LLMFKKSIVIKRVLEEKSAFDASFALSIKQKKPVTE